MMLLPTVGVLSVLTGTVLSAADMKPDTCLTLDPFDGVIPQQSAFPYLIVSSKTGVIHNQDSIMVSIKSTDPRVEFEQFLVQARDNLTGLAVGMFVDTGDADISLANCFGRIENTALEFDSEPKREVRMRWMPDFDYQGFVTFIATVVQNDQVYWLRQPADTLQVYNPW